jgi:adenylosuccinate synthase
MIAESVDAVIGLQYGDEGKGKITASLIEQKRYSMTARFSGGPNAGHSIHKKNGAHYSLHQIPSSVPYQELGMIGPGCVLDVNKLYLEIEEFKKVEGFDPTDYLIIHPEVSLINENHINLDSHYHHAKQGSTASGIAPAYSEYFNRIATLVKDVPELTSFIEEKQSIDTLLLEGAQGFYLNPHSGNYPYVTSSSSHPAAAAASFGFSPTKFNNIIGVAKCYETRSGLDPNFFKTFENGKFLNYDLDHSSSDEMLFQKIQEEGKEFGVTTGRKRAVRFLCLERLIHSIQSTGTNIVVINKWDILEKLNIFKIYLKNKPIKFNNSLSMFKFLNDQIKFFCPNVKHVIYSANKQSDINWNQYIND